MGSLMIYTPHPILFGW